MKIKYRWQYILIVLVFCTSSVYFAWHLNLKRDYYYSTIPIVFNDNQCPFVCAHVDGVPYSLSFALGAKYPLFLPKKALESIHTKRPNGMRAWTDEMGKHHESFAYTVPKIHLNGLTLRQVLVCEDDQFYPGILGQTLGGNFNVLLDFPHARVIVCDSLSTLKSHKLKVDDWVHVPFTLRHNGVILDVVTDYGVKRLALNTTTSRAELRTFPIDDIPQWTQQNSPHIHSSKLVIGGRDFGGLNFAVCEITPLLEGIDGFLTMEFLRQHAIYLDYKHQIAYIEPPKEYFVTLPVAFNSANLPCLATTIGDTSCLCLLDLGSDAPFSLDPIVLESMDKELIERIRTFDFKGNEYMQPLFKIPTTKVGELVFTEPLAEQIDPQFHVNTMLVTDDSVHVFGSIGVPILEKYNLCLDFQRSVVYAASSLAEVKAHGLLQGDIIQIPFTTVHDLIMLNIETDLGKKRFILDTGFTCNAINIDLVQEEQIIKSKRTGLDYFDSQRFILQGQDFGWQRMVCLKIGAVFQCDGFLGMDFLRDHTLYIDYPNRIIYLEVPSSEEKVQ